jgi:hypothetical protein
MLMSLFALMALAEFAAHLPCTAVSAVVQRQAGASSNAQTAMQDIQEYSIVVQAHTHMWDVSIVCIAILKSMVWQCAMYMAV